MLPLRSSAWACRTIHSANSAALPVALLAESIADPFDVAGESIDEEDVEAALGLRPARKIKARRGEKAAALGGGHAFSRAAISERPAHAHLGEDQDAALLGDQIDFAEAAAPVPLHDTQSGLAQQLCAAVLG